MNLITHMATHFPGLTLEPPLFYRWPTALRFELNAELPTTPYFDTVYHRAINLYESAFAPEDRALVATVNDRFPGLGRHKRTDAQSLFSLAKRINLGIGRPSGTHSLMYDAEHKEDFGSDQAKIRWAEISPRRINYASILRGIAHTDFPYVRFKPSRGHFPTSDRIYFINLSRHLIFHMYDDRGLDMIAAHRAALQPIYETYKNWLLHYDIERMAATFGAQQSSLPRKTSGATLPPA